MPVDGRIDGQFVGHEHLNVISFINFNQRARLLAIDKIDVATDTVWALSVESSPTRLMYDSPGALFPRWTVKLYVLKAALESETFRRIHIATTDRYQIDILISVW